MDIALVEILLRMQDGLAERTKKLHKRYPNLSDNYALAVRMHLPCNQEGVPTDCMILSGTTPTIVVSTELIFALNKPTWAEKDLASKRLDDVLLSALRLIPKLTRSLALVPIADAVALRNKTSKWNRASRSSFPVELPERYFSETLDVTVTCALTNRSITRHGVHERDLAKTRADLRAQLAAEALSDPANLEVLDAEETGKAYHKEYKANRAFLRSKPNRKDGDGVDASFRYDGDDPADSVDPAVIPKVAE